MFIRRVLGICSTIQHKCTSGRSYVREVEVIGICESYNKKNTHLLEMFYTNDTKTCKF